MELSHDILAERPASVDEALDRAAALAREFAGRAAGRDRDRALPHDEVHELFAHGLGAVSVPRERGGLGGGGSVLAQITATLAAADGSIGQIPQNHYYALEVLRLGGTPAQQAFFYGRALAGEQFGNAVAEIGQRDYRRTTRLTTAPGRWRVDGRKFYCTGALFAQWIPTRAVREENGADVSCQVFIPRHAPGVTVIDDWDGFGQRATGSGTVVFDDVTVEPEWVLPFQALFARPNTIGALGQLLHAAIDLGLARAAHADMLSVVRTRARPWMQARVDRAADDPLTLHRIGELSVRLAGAEALVRRAGRAVDAAQARPDAEHVAQASVAVAEARVATTEAALASGSHLFELGGTSSALGDDAPDRHWRNARVHTLHDPVRWKLHAVGNHALNGRRPPSHGAL